MSADFWAGYLSGATGILVGSPLDMLKTRLQAGGYPKSAEAILLPEPTQAKAPWEQRLGRVAAFARGSAAPILGYGALNALLFVTYNHSLTLLNAGAVDEAHPPSPWKLWTAGAIGGLATFVVSAPTENVKCRAQVSRPPRSSVVIAADIWRDGGLRAFYRGGTITAVRDAVGYGFYFWSYEVGKRALSAEDDSERQQAMKIVLCGGLAGMATWTSIFPLDVIKTRVQTQGMSIAAAVPLLSPNEQQPLLEGRVVQGRAVHVRLGAVELARQAYLSEGARVFFRGLAVCNVRAFIVNAVQWAVYEWVMRILA